jgi:hypothetical protein
MLTEADACASQGACNVKKKKRKNKLYYSSKKALEKLRMRVANIVPKFRAPAKLLNFEDADIANIASVSDKVL